MNSSAFRLFLAIGVASAVLVGCGGGDDEDDGGTTEPEVLTSQEIIAKATPATVKLSGRLGDAKVGGTGVLYSTDSGARVLTNAHVVQGLSTIQAEVDGQNVSARRVGTAPCQDLAVLELVNAPSDLVTMPLGDSASVENADSVVALGFPITAQRSGSAAITSTTGEVSNPEVVGNQVSPDLPEYPQLIQHTATVNPGNSGGPLINDAGEVVGINTLSSAGSDVVEGQSYAISIDHVKTILPTLEAGQDQVDLGWNLLPLELTPPAELAQDLIEQFGISANLAVRVAKSIVGGGDKGLYNLGSEPGSPAAKAQIVQGDLIKEINGSSVKTIPQVCKILESASPGQTLQIDGQFVASGTVDQLIDEAPFRVDMKIPDDQVAMTNTPEPTTTTSTP
jgi:S1-C subfamily serine protease